MEMLLPMITSPLLSRRLGADALGIYTYNYSIVSMFAVVAELGCYRYGMREIAKVRDDKNKLRQTYSDIFFLHFFNGMIVSFFYLLYISATHYNVYALIMLGSIFSNMLDNSFLFIGTENIGSLSLRDGSAKIITFLLILLCIKTPDDLLKYVVIMTAGSVACKIVALVYSRKYSTLSKPNFKSLFTHYKPMLILMIPALMAVIYQSMDKVMIGLLYNNADVGYYECASKALIPRNIITVLGTVLCPQIANLYAGNSKEKVSEIFSKSFKVSMALAYVFMFGISAIAYDFAPWFWGLDFSVCSPMLVGLSVTIPLWTIGEVIRNQYLLPIGRDNEYAISFVIGVICNAVVNAILIPKYGAMGAIAATITAEFVMSLVQMLMVQKEIKCIKYILETAPYFFIGVAMLTATRMAANKININVTLKLLIEIVCGALLYTLLTIGYELLSGRRFMLLLLKKTKKEV